MSHGHTTGGIGGHWTREYRSYQCMRTRCYTEDSGSYVRYGGRGIRVCDRWLASFESFLADMGLAPSSKHQLDRVNPDGDYEPGNCRWATVQENNATRRNRIQVVVDGRSMLLSDAATNAGLKSSTVEARLRLGWTLSVALGSPSNGFGKSRDPILRALQLACHRVGARWSVVRKRIVRGWPVSRALVAEARRE